MKPSNIIKIIADKVGAMLISLLFLASFALMPLLVSLHFYRNNDFLCFIVFMSLATAVGLSWLGLARWRKWPADRYAKTSRSDTDA